ncbi:MAG: hypothetical protein IJY03_04320 [Prevotella sp.]|nr:hypothetical protein [Prevotella sp.]
MTKKVEAVTLLALIDKVRECRRKQTTFRRQKNTENYKAMLACEDETDALLREVRKRIASDYSKNIDVLP